MCSNDGANKTNKIMINVLIQVNQFSSVYTENFIENYLEENKYGYTPEKYTYVINKEFDNKGIEWWYVYKSISKYEFNQIMANQ